MVSIIRSKPSNITIMKLQHPLFFMEVLSNYFQFTKGKGAAQSQCSLRIHHLPINRSVYITQAAQHHIWVLRATHNTIYGYYVQHTSPYMGITCNTQHHIWAYHVPSFLLSRPREVLPSTSTTPTKGLLPSNSNSPTLSNMDSI